MARYLFQIPPACRLDIIVIAGEPMDVKLDLAFYCLPYQNHLA